MILSGFICFAVCEEDVLGTDWGAKGTTDMEGFSRKWEGFFLEKHGPFHDCEKLGRLFPSPKTKIISDLKRFILLLHED